jgi:hypothetical protein
VETIRKYFKEIVICDISASLLEMAQKRINAMGIQDIARVVEHDVTQQSMFAVLPAAGSVDVITMSYSFSMIPDQKAAIANATKVRMLLLCCLCATLLRTCGAALKLFFSVSAWGQRVCDCGSLVVSHELAILCTMQRHLLLPACTQPLTELILCLRHTSCYYCTTYSC